MWNELKIPFIIVAVFCLGLIGCNGKTTDPDENLPIDITVPSNGDVLSQPITVIARTSAESSIDDVEFYVDSNLRWIDNNAPFEFYWNIFEYENNSEHILTAVGTSEDSTYMSDPVTVTISLEEGLAFVSAYRPNNNQSFGVTTYGGLMFVATGEDGVEVIDISNITFPTFISRFESAGQARKVDAQYPDLFIADLDGGVVRTDFSNPDSLVETGSYNIGSRANDVAISGDIAIVADQNGFIILDNNIPDSLPSLFRSTSFSNSNYVVARNDTAYITNLSNLFIINAADPGSPEIIFAYDSFGASGVAVVDTFAFVANGDQGVISISISDPAAPGFLARYDLTQTNVSAVAAIDSTAFIGTFSGEVIALDYSQGDTLIAIDNLVIQNAGILDLHYEAPYLFAAGLDGVSIIRFIKD